MSLPVEIPPSSGLGGSSTAAATEAAGSGGAGAGGAALEDEIANPCPICLDNEDDAVVDGNEFGMCTACGQFYCGACNTADHVGRLLRCPTCRAPISVLDEENFKRCWKLVHDRSPGRHTPAAQNNLGGMYENGKGVAQDHVAQHNLGYMYDTGRGVEQDHVEAAKWSRKSAEAGIAAAQCNLGVAYSNGEGVEQDVVKGVKWLQFAAVQGNEPALTGLDDLQQGNVIPTPPPGTTVTIILLTSANAAKYNNKAGRVVEPAEGVAIKPGRAAVLLDGEAKP
eukprot:gene22301-biopygen21355